MSGKARNAPPRVLYVEEGMGKAGLRRFIRNKFISAETRTRITGRGSFFEAALRSACKVSVIQLRLLLLMRHWAMLKYDAVVVNSDCATKGSSLRSYEWLAKIRIPKVLFVTGARAHVLPAEHVLQRFDLVYKREVVKDATVYKVSENSLSKIRRTMISCPLVTATKNTAIPYVEIPESRAPGAPYSHDVFFSGKLKTNPIRGAILEKLTQAGVDLYGGLQTEGDAPSAHEKLNLPRHGEYMDAIRRSKINLAPEGFGQLTHRHLEIWCMGSFCLSTPSIRDVTLPYAQPIDGEHYVAFEDLDDMISKIEYYLSHDAERERIAANGRKLFVENYDVQRHGDDIRREIEALLEKQQKRKGAL